MVLNFNAFVWSFEINFEFYSVKMMSDEKYGNYWELLNKYNLKIETKMYSDLICVICKNTLKNARQSLCSCRYCFDYIENYLNGTEGMCPDSLSDYRNQVISLRKDMQIDHVANMKASRITVKCPESISKFEDELRNIEDRINSHEIKCPYFDIGCSDLTTNNLNINYHLVDEEFSNTSLLMDSI